MPEGVKRILVVDDDVDLREFLVFALNARGYAVDSAANGLEALAAVERARPALVLLDMKMPVMDGWAFARALDERGIRRPVIVAVTAAYDPAERASEIRADGWLPKPFELEDLYATVDRYLP